MFIYNQIIICQEIIGSQPSVLCTNGKVHVSKIDFQLVWLIRSGIMRKNIFVTHNYYVYSTIHASWYLPFMLVFMIHAGIYDPCWYLRFMLVFTIHAGIYDSCWYLWSAVCVKTQDDAGIYDSCWYLHFMLVFTIPA